MERFSLQRVCKMAIMSFVNTIPVSGQTRYHLLKWGGVKVVGSQGYIGSKVTFDSIRPDLITIEDGVYITEECLILTHHLASKTFKKDGAWWTYGQVRICKDAFIGARTIICNAVTIGENSIIGAGSVVTKDIPANEIWAGNPARFIKKR